GVRLLDSRTDRLTRSVRARLIGLQALLRQAQQRALPALKLASKAIEEAHAAGDDIALARAYLVSDWANRMLGNHEAAVHEELARDLYENAGDLDGAAKASNNLGASAYNEGRWDDAMVWYRRALDAYGRCGNDTSAAVAGTNLGELLVSRRLYADAERVLQDAVRVLRAAGALDDLLFAELQMARLLVERGDAESAVELLIRLRSDATALGQVGYVFEVAMQLAFGLVALGQYGDALQTLDDAVRDVGFVDPIYQPILARARAAALVGCGRPDEATRVLNEGLASAREQARTHDEGLLLYAAARLEHARGGRPSPDTLDTMTVILARLDLRLPAWDELAHDRHSVRSNGEAQPESITVPRFVDGRHPRVLLVSDLHYSLRQFDWVVGVASNFDLVVLAGDLLDVSSNVEADSQIVVVLKYLELLASIGPVVVASGNHDLTGADASGERAATWLAEAQELGIVVDGQSLVAGDTLITVCPWWDGPVGRAAVDAQLAADACRRPARWIWVYHWPPAASLTSWTGSKFYGDVDLAQWIADHKPDIVLTGHVHESPFKADGSWADRIGETWVFNAGRQIGETPTRIELNLDDHRATWVSLRGVEELDLRDPALNERTLV
ncbi:MAG TPA: metallophosphoesterase, partial [Ilumatobacter sp.]